MQHNCTNRNTPDNDGRTALTATLRLSCAFIALLWLAATRGLTDEPSPGIVPVETPITADDWAHWSFQPLQRISPPAVRDTVWPRNAIDRFILAKLEEAGLRPMPEADRYTLIRRVTFDLTGLPTAPGQIEQFVNDPTVDAYERLVDRLLASRSYAERAAQHWLDLVRFAETDGYEHDNVRPDAWKYRDWVIDAFDRDLPYDEFVRLQIAGDELQPGDRTAAIATALLLCGPDMPDINVQEERRHDFLNDMTATVGSVFLGLQMGCAQCHHHKYDPISQHDFYRLRAFFDPCFRFDRYRPVIMARAADKSGESHLMIRGDFRRPGPQMAPGFPRIADALEYAGSTVEGDAQNGASPPRTQLAHWLTRPDHPLATRVAVNRLWQQHFGRGIVESASDFGVMGDWPTHPQLLDWLAAELPRQRWGLKAMHRLMVTSATYRQASRPTGFGLAAEQSREMSARWRQGVAEDPGNRLLWRMPRQRLDGEAIRDAMLAASERLSLRHGGPGVRPPLPDEVRATLLKDQWPVTEDERDHRRRSIYLFVRRNLRYPLFEAFDKPDTNASCPRRNRSTTAPQALVLLNSELSLHAARDLCHSLIENAGREPQHQVELCYLRVLGRPPTAGELRTALDFLADDSAELRQGGRAPESLASPSSLPEGIDPYHAAALTDFCLSLFNLNEFLYVD